MEEQKVVEEESCQVCPSGDAMVCYCYRLTTNTLKKAYAQYGSLAEVEKHTRAGTGCTGCKVILKSLFHEEPSGSAISEVISPLNGTACVKPGNRAMKGFVIANGDLESAIFSSNGVAPQLGNCDATTRIRWTLFDPRGVPIIRDEGIFDTNQTFKFDTKNYQLPRPFYGIFQLEFGRSNYGGSRFNIHWYNKNSVTTTHEIGSSGRPRVFLPLIIDQGFLQSPLSLYLALYNPHLDVKQFMVTLFDVDDGRSVQIPGALGGNGSLFVDAIQTLFRPAMERLGKGRFALRLESDGLNLHGATTVNFFIHHRELDTWTVNHL